jgi:hypothetical protein
MRRNHLISFFAMGFLAVSAASGCSIDRKLKKLDDQEFQHYYALKVYMDEPQVKTYLKLKTRPERDEYLKKRGLWDKYYEYEPHIREAIYNGRVEIGWTKDMVLMAWGRPIDRGRVAGRQASRSERYIYRFEENQEGAILVWEPGSKTQYKAARLFSREVVMDNDVVAEINNKDRF